VQSRGSFRFVHNERHMGAASITRTPASSEDIREDSERFANTLAISDEDREKVYRCLREFPLTLQARGMFSEGVLDLVRREHGAARAHELLLSTGIGYRITNLGLLKHRDWYKVYYAGAALMYPGVPLGLAMERLADGFYPRMFAHSVAGKTMALLIGRDPANVLARLVDAYSIACHGNEHEFERRADGRHRWRCTVEPCEFYPHTFQGIARGMVKQVAGVDPVATVIEHSRTPDEHRYVFEVRFE
jgi:uncharacterized protein (TIGR02265 family)